MELVFEAKQKKMIINVYGEKHEIRVPKMHEGDEFRGKLEQAEAKDAHKVYTEFFLSLGLPEEAIKKLDSIDYNELLGFILYPKKS